MRIVITGGTGFLGRHLARHLSRENHEVIVMARGRRDPPAWMDEDPNVTITTGSVSSMDRLLPAFRGADAAAHLAGINFQRGTQTYAAVHERGTKNVMAAAARQGVERVVLSSYLRARPGTRSKYLQSKWIAEERVRSHPMPATVLKPAAIFGPGDQLFRNLAQWIATFPLVPIPRQAPPLRPIAVDDVVDVGMIALTSDRLHDKTIPLMGPETLTLRQLVERIARHLDRWAVPVPTPTTVLNTGAMLQERLLDDPVVTRAGVRMLREGMTIAAPASQCEPLPPELAPTRTPDYAYIQSTLGQVDRLGIADLRLARQLDQ